MSQTYTASEQAYSTVKEQIVTGELPGGELVSEGDVAGRMGISRTPVREAFLRLQVEGWMKLYPKRGALVVPIAPGEAEHVVSARWLVETGSVRTVAADERKRTELVAHLRGSLARQREIAASGTRAEFSDADADFHRLIVRAGGNPLLDAFYAGLRERQRRMTFRSLEREPEQIQRIIDDHAQLTDLVDAGDADGFSAAVDRHMRRTHDLNYGGPR